MYNSERIQGLFKKSLGCNASSMGTFLWCISKPRKILYDAFHVIYPF